jgi:glycosyltransferase involved in cell wall biosynthesis
MVTNTFRPLICGVTRSVESLACELRDRDHRTIVVAPGLEDGCTDDDDTVRVPTVAGLNGSGRSLPLPAYPWLVGKLGGFEPDVVHSHHPFLLGMTGARLARHYGCPLVFTHHTMYDHYLRGMAWATPALTRVVLHRVMAYTSRCDRVFAPSTSVAEMLKHRGMETAVSTVPTGLDLNNFDRGARERIRSRLRVPETSFVFGHVGRLEKEKNLEFLGRAVEAALSDLPSAHFLLVGEGRLLSKLRSRFASAGLNSRVHMTGALQGQSLVDAYHAMNGFVFASRSETQGLVLSEAMACGLPTIAIDGSGVRDAVKDRRNGRLLPSDAPVQSFADAMMWLAYRTHGELAALSRNARSTVQGLSIDRTTNIVVREYWRTIEAYELAKRRRGEAATAERNMIGDVR